MAIEKVYIQKEKVLTSGNTITASPVYDPSTAPSGSRTWGLIFTNSIPFSMFGDLKDLYSNDWHDEHGLEEYADEDGGIYRKHYDMEIKWIYKGDKYSANTYIQGFLDYLSGKDGSGVWFKIYCTWTRIGRRHVRLLKVDPSAEIVRNGCGDVIVFKTTLRVCDPVTDITLTV